MSRARSATSVLAAVLAAVAVGAGAPPAYACALTQTCHAQVVYDVPAGGYLTGGLATINVAASSVPNPASNFINHELWVSTSNQNCGGCPFIEIGEKYGYAQGYGNLGRIIFWQEWNPNSGRLFHPIQFANPGASYNVKVSYSGSNSWGVYLNGTSLGGTSRNQPCCTTHMSAGGEATSNTPTSNATLSALQKRDYSNSWSYTWPGAQLRQDWAGNNPLIPTWLTPGASMVVHT